MEGHLDASSIIFMIVGPHSGYSLASIFEMKCQEEAELGVMYWGYAGSLCRPARVQAFARAHSEKGPEKQGPVKLVMVSTKAAYTSKYVGKCSQISTDGATMLDLPQGVVLIGNTAALVCKNLEVVSFMLDLNQYAVANGPQAGRALGAYIRYQVNKACAVRVGDCGETPRLVRVCAIADIAPPFCVYTHGDVINGQV